MSIAPAQGRRIGLSSREPGAPKVEELLLDRMPLRAAGAVMDSGSGPDSVLATLRVRSGLPASGTMPVRGPQATIGADSASDVQVDLQGVAARHAQLRLRGGVWTLVDFGSPTGSSVDGVVVRGEALLAPGSSIRIGPAEFAFAPLDRWEDSPPERRAGDRAPVLLLPADSRRSWPTILFILLVGGLFVAAYFLLGNP